MQDWIIIFSLLIIVGGVISLAIVFTSKEGRGDLNIGGKNPGFRFWFSRDVQLSRPSSNKELGLVEHPSNSWLEIKQAHKKPWRYPLTKTQHVYIGRRNDNEITLNDPMCDARQAVVYWDALSHRYKINNLSTTSPTMINNRRITKQNLGDGNTIHLGNTRMIYRERSKP